MLHLFFSVDQASWDLYDGKEKIERKTALSMLVQEIRATADTELVTLSVVTPKADLGFILVTPDLHVADEYAKKLGLVLGPGVLTPQYSWLSVTERGESLCDESTSSSLQGESVSPILPDWPVVGFYAMSRRRGGPVQNWYELSPAERQDLLACHARIAGDYADRVVRFMTGSCGLDDMDWGITLFARTTSDVKAYVGQTRSDEAGARYTDCVEFFIGLQLPLDLLFARVNI